MIQNGQNNVKADDPINASASKNSEHCETYHNKNKLYLLTFPFECFEFEAEHLYVR